MTGTVLVRGKMVRFRLSPGLAKAQLRTRSQTMTEHAAVAFVEAKRKRRLLREAKPYLATGS
jgi:Holliday junction resolvase-like predicted endonuclease